MRVERRSRPAPPADAMRCLTLTQPWAGLMAAGIKLVENRTTPKIARTAIGTRYALQASLEIDEDVYQRISEIAPELRADIGNLGVPWYRMSRITGAILAVATLADIVDLRQYRLEKHEGTPEARQLIQAKDQRRWFFQRIGYVNSHVIALPEPVPCSGCQAFFRLQPAVQARVEAQLR